MSSGVDTPRDDAGDIIPPQFDGNDRWKIEEASIRDGHKLIAVVLGEATGGERSVRAANMLEHGFQTYAWKALFSPQTLETMPMSEDAKGPVTIRQLVRSFVCGTGGRRHTVSKARRKKGPAVSEQEQKAPARKRARKASAASTSQQ